MKVKALDRDLRRGVLFAIGVAVANGSVLVSELVKHDWFHALGSVVYLACNWSWYQIILMLQRTRDQDRANMKSAGQLFDILKHYQER